MGAVKALTLMCHFYVFLLLFFLQALMGQRITAKIQTIKIL